jgi:hypothetical protein
VAGAAVGAALPGEEGAAPLGGTSVDVFAQPEAAQVRSEKARQEKENS